MAKIILEISEEIQDALRFPPDEIEQEVRKELALALYQRHAISIGKACSFAQMTRWEFEDLLGHRKIQRHYSKEDLQEDIRYAKGH